jgi:alpha-L-rhamnosidase
MFFLKSKPMWAKNEENTMNYHLVLKADVLDPKDTVLYLTAAYTYRLTVNGEFVFYGPARAAEGYSRVDEISLNKFGGNKAEIIIEVSGYNCRSYVCTKQPSFIVAELRRGEDVLLTTADFDAYKNVNVVSEVLRYSGQRHFTEVYDYTNKIFSEENKVELSISNNIDYLERRVDYPNFDLIGAKKITTGKYYLNEQLPFGYCPAIFHGKNDWGKFDETEIKYDPFNFVSGCKFEESNTDLSALNPGEYVVYDLGKIYSGFLNLSFSATNNSDIIIAFSEMCESEPFEYTPCACRNAIEIITGVGDKSFLSFEPYTARFVAVLVKSGEINLKDFSLRTYERSAKNVKKYKGSDKELERIYNAAIRSFCHNAVDIYTDCPSRERAGWLCDSFFSGKAEFELFGTHTVEDNFLENYVLFPGNKLLPEGVLPMCYPADINFPEDGGFIPQWNLWYVLEVCDYLTSRNPEADRQRFKKSVYGVLDFWAKYENSDGLAENLPSWNFVEWSTANDWTWNVNYPTNFLYSEALLKTGEVFEDERLIKKAKCIKEKVAQLSFNGEVFCDHAIRNADGILENQPHVSAAAQYYAALFGGIDIYSEKYKKLLHHIRENFENLDKENIQFVPVNAFIGFYLRMEYLMRHGEKELLMRDIKDFFAQTVIRTDTLWEHKYLSGSLDHGFSSYVVLAINEISE